MIKTTKPNEKVFSNSKEFLNFIKKNPTIESIETQRDDIFDSEINSRYIVKL